MVKPRYSPEELARMGDAIYERDILPHMTPEDTGHIVAIDVESGAYAVDQGQLAAVHRILDGKADAQIWLRRVGFSYVDRLGASHFRPSMD
jgi:23S rRNA maturation mini-RNase III